MENNKAAKPPVWFWIVSTLALLWNLIGVSQYLAQELMTDEDKALMTPDQLSLLENTPTWLTAAFAIAVWFGVIASIGLLMRKKWAKSVFLVSFIAVVIQMGYSAFMTGAAEVYGPIAFVMAGITTLAAALLFYFSGIATKKHWLH